MTLADQITRAGGVVPVWVAASVLRVSRQRVYHLLGNGKLLAVSVQGGKLVSWSSVLQRHSKPRQHVAPRGPALGARALPVTFKMPVAFPAAVAVKRSRQS